jgi:hypothetical protein
LSPTFFIHFVTVPSAIDSPIWGMMTSVIDSPRTAAFSSQHSALSPAALIADR